MQYWDQYPIASGSERVFLSWKGEITDISTSLECSHAFSEIALHSYFQHQIMQELMRRHPYMQQQHQDRLSALFRIDRAQPQFLIPLRAWSDDFLAQVCAIMPRLALNYVCPLCRTSIKRPPVQSLPLTQLFEKLVCLLDEDELDAESRQGVDIGWAGYFAFNCFD